MSLLYRLLGLIFEQPLHFLMNILRSVVAGPRARHPEANLDLCYVTDCMIATSGPSATYPQLAYRNPLSELTRFLDKKHGADWAIWEFRAEGTGYPDAEVYHRIWHHPWPDHHPPPFALVPEIMASMRAWLHGDDGGAPGPHSSPQSQLVLSDGVHSNGKRVVVVHCKAGKGRSGTSLVSYLISEEGWAMERALQRFTQRRMRPGFGAGVSIPSQLRYVGYVQTWAARGKRYVDRRVEVLEVHVWGLREGCKVAVEGFVDAGRTIKTFHVFSKEERDDGAGAGAGDGDGDGDGGRVLHAADRLRGLVQPPKSSAPSSARTSLDSPSTTESSNTILRPSARLILPTSDINLAIERRTRAGYGWAMVTSIAHVWFNVFFEGLQGSTSTGAPASSGVFAIPWDDMDGIKGSSRKGVRAFNKVAVVWRVVEDGGSGSAAEEVERTRTTGDDRPGAGENEEGMARDLGLQADDADEGGTRGVEDAGGVAARNREDDDDASFEGVETGVRLPGE